MDHYLDKVKGMHEEKEARAAKGKEETAKQVEALARNEEKKKAAIADYEFARNVVCEAMDTEATLRLDEFNKVFIALVKFQQQWLEQVGATAPALSTAVSSLQTLVGAPPERPLVGQAHRK